MIKLDAVLAEKGLRPGDAYKDYFVFYRSFADMLRSLPDKYKLALLDALMDFGLDMKEPDFSGDAILAALWAGMSPQLEANWIKTLNGKDGAKFGVKGAKFGVKGGAPAGNQNARKDKNNPPTPPQQPPNNPPTPDIYGRGGGERKKGEVEVEGKGNIEGKTAMAATPTADDVSSYFQQIGLTKNEADKFFSMYSARGWTDNQGRPIVNWKAVADYWAKRKEDQPPTPPQYDKSQYLASDFLKKEGII